MKQPFLPSNSKERSASNRFGSTTINPLGLALTRLLQLCLQFCNEHTWPEFIRLTQPVISRTIIRAVRSRQAPQPAMFDDLVQETYLKLCSNDFKALRELQIENDAQLLGYLKVVASNVVQDHFRAEVCHKRGSGLATGDLDSAAPFTTDPLHSIERRDRRILVREIADCIRSKTSGPHAARDYAIFWLYYVVGYSAAEIARHPSIGLSVKGVESALLRITTLVREGLTGKDSHTDRPS